MTANCLAVTCDMDDGDNIFKAEQCKYKHSPFLFIFFSMSAAARQAAEATTVGSLQERRHATSARQPLGWCRLPTSTAAQICMNGGKEGFSGLSTLDVLRTGPQQAWVTPSQKRTERSKSRIHSLCTFTIPEDYITPMKKTYMRQSARPSQTTSPAVRLTQTSLRNPA
jgi:hypothetical protein